MYVVFFLMNGNVFVTCNVCTRTMLEEHMQQVQENFCVCLREAFGKTDEAMPCTPQTKGQGSHGKGQGQHGKGQKPKGHKGSFRDEEATTYDEDDEESSGYV